MALKKVAETEKEFKLIEQMEKDLTEADDMATKATWKAIKKVGESRYCRKRRFRHCFQPIGMGYLL